MISERDEGQDPQTEDPQTEEPADGPDAGGTSQDKPGGA